MKKNIYTSFDVASYIKEIIYIQSSELYFLYNFYNVQTSIEFF